MPALHCLGGEGVWGGIGGGRACVTMPAWREHKLQKRKKGRSRSAVTSERWRDDCAAAASARRRGSMVMVLQRAFTPASPSLHLIISAPGWAFYYQILVVIIIT